MVLQGDSSNRNVKIINWPADVGRVVVISSDFLAIIYSIENLFVRQEVVKIVLYFVQQRTFPLSYNFTPLCLIGTGHTF